VLQQLHLQHEVSDEVEAKNDVKVTEEEEMEDASVVALAPHEESNINMPQHAMEEEVQHQHVEDAPVGVVEAYAGKEEDECAAVQERKFEGCHLLAKVVNTESSGAGSRTQQQWRRRKSGTSDTTVLGTFSDPINL
jgi:ABC-type phosphate/phosphonate transport system substrate-binding protein